jgi:hypothetical protein
LKGGLPDDVKLALRAFVLPTGVGRYHWALAGEMLHLDLGNGSVRAPVSSMTRRLAGSG